MTFPNDDVFDDAQTFPLVPPPSPSAIISTLHTQNRRTCLFTVISCLFLYRRNARHLGEDEDPLTQCVRQGGEELKYCKVFLWCPSSVTFEL